MSGNWDEQNQQAAIHRQAETFLKREGDEWFYRNQLSISTNQNFFDTQIIKRVLGTFRNEICNILEIGCSNGAKLLDLCEFFSAKGSGVDPSRAAIQDGKAKHSKLSLSVATASNLPLHNKDFDLVYFGFCLYLVDREDIFQAIAEADRVLKPGGFIAIQDFDPAQRNKKPYKHEPGIFSYKNSYTNFFTAGGHYYLVAKESFSHQAHEFALESDERVSLCILYKEIDSYQTISPDV